MPADENLPEEVEQLLALGNLDGAILFLFSRPTFLANRFFALFRRKP
ncbi:hypothetical protein [Tenggerimyces flavus]|uniref:Uncharacterized protein n=1 Tax=Tenggerimyces flavus TaxID=1708749 RepID=A0ABV7Y3T4_9ACTN|nr:hypothetical protein [Tenggerimyces flavus]MBM7790914.1 hypothetical protein [Tenggerimyces flavus]